MKLAVLVLLALSPLALPLSAATLNVRDFGAKGDGVAVDTMAIQKALDACYKVGGTVELPAGTYLSRPIRIFSDTTLQLDPDATLLAVTNQQEFMKTPGDWLHHTSDFIPLIYGSNVHDVTITGGGTIDGSGHVWWGEAEKARQRKPGYTLPRPNMVEFSHAKNLRVENVTLQNSPKFHLVPSDCEDVVISNVTILAPERAANTDAIDPGNCRNVLITKCHIDVGDDNVAIKSGKKVEGREFASENITVTDCTFLHGHGMSIGSETTGGIHHVVVRDCTFENTENGLRIKSHRGKGGVVSDIIYDHITMKNVDPAITLTCFYQNNSAGDASVSTNLDAATLAEKHIPEYRDIHISNLTATCPRAAGIITGLPESSISDVTLENVQITATNSFSISNAKGIQLKNVQVAASAAEPFKLENAEVSGLPVKP